MQFTELWGAVRRYWIRKYTNIVLLGSKKSCRRFFRKLSTAEISPRLFSSWILNKYYDRYHGLWDLGASNKTLDVRRSAKNMKWKNSVFEQTMNFLPKTREWKSVGTTSQVLHWVCKSTGLNQRHALFQQVELFPIKLLAKSIACFSKCFCRKDQEDKKNSIFFRQKWSFLDCSALGTRVVAVGSIVLDIWAINEKMSRNLRRKANVTIGAYLFHSKPYKLKLKCKHISCKILTRKFFSRKFLGQTFHILQESCKHLARFNLVCNTLARNDWVFKKLARNVDFASILQDSFKICCSCWPGKCWLSFE